MSTGRRRARSSAARRWRRRRSSAILERSVVRAAPDRPPPTSIAAIGAASDRLSPHDRSADSSGTPRRRAADVAATPASWLSGRWSATVSSAAPTEAPAVNATTSRSTVPARCPSLLVSRRRCPRERFRRGKAPDRTARASIAPAAREACRRSVSGRDTQPATTTMHAQSATTSSDISGPRESAQPRPPDGEQEAGGEETRPAGRRPDEK